MTEPTAQNFDDVDVPAALARVTADGYGTDVLPEPDFVSFATDDVEMEDDK